MRRSERMRKGIFVVCVAVLVLAMVMAAAAKEDTGKKVETPKKVESNNDGNHNDDNGSNSQGQPFLEIWKAIKVLQDKLNSCVTRAEFGELKARVADLEADVVDLEGRVAVLEGDTNPPPTCVPGVTCTVPGVLGVCTSGTTQCSDGVSSCLQSQQPQPEVCDGYDNNCDGMTDEGTNLCISGQVCYNGQCTTDVCTQNPCTSPPGPTCDGNSVVTYGTESGVCTSTGVGYTCDYGNPTTTACDVASPVCESGSCKFTCAGLVDCLSGCSATDSDCPLNCKAQASQNGLQDQAAFEACYGACDDAFPPVQSCKPDCDNLYPTCIG
jgi:hypothetical protein